ITVRPEIEDALSLQMADEYVEKGILPSQLPKTIQSAIAELAEDRLLICIVSFHTDRTRIRCHDKELSILLEIDKTGFADGSVDYELEIELFDKKLSNRVIAVITGLMKSLEIPITFQKESKLARALRRAADR
ncbi:MAG: hypothetical protein JSV44_03110, partial [Candidatus Zixiibacteriota bacterium]